jgi:hypothetical protein
MQTKDNNAAASGMYVGTASERKHFFSFLSIHNIIWVLGIASLFQVTATNTTQQHKIQEIDKCC